MKKWLMILILGVLFFGSSGFDRSSSVNNYELVPIDPEKFVERHNFYREQVGVPAVSWSVDLAEYAEGWALRFARNCRMKHRTEDDFGENLFWASSYKDEAYVVDDWAEEEASFNHKKPIYHFGKGIGHYTQMIWKETEHIGAACVKCSNGGYIWVCNYDPPGNYEGERVY